MIPVDLPQGPTARGPLPQDRGVAPGLPLRGRPLRLPRRLRPHDVRRPLLQHHRHRPNPEVCRPLCSRVLLVPCLIIGGNPAVVGPRRTGQPVNRPCIRISVYTPHKYETKLLSPPPKTPEPSEFYALRSIFVAATTAAIRYDFSAALVALVASVPGTHIGPAAAAARWGQGRLRALFDREGPLTPPFVARAPTTPSELRRLVGRGAQVVQ